MSHMKPCLAEPVAKAPPATIKVQVRLEEITLRNKWSFVTGTFLKTHSVGGRRRSFAQPNNLVRSRLMDIPVSENAKIKIGDKAGKLTDLPPLPKSVTMELAVEEDAAFGSRGIQTIEKQT